MLDFFRACGLGKTELSDVSKVVAADPKSITKFEIVRRVAMRLNSRDDNDALRMRREVLRRVVEWRDFSTCWPDKRDAAVGRVARIREIVNKVDSFTRMAKERDAEARRHRRQYEEQAAKKRERVSALGELEAELGSFFSEQDPQLRGRLLENMLNRYFLLEGVLVKESFHVVKKGVGTVEQIDGAIVIDGNLTLVEIKWWKGPIGAEPVGFFLSKIFTRDCGGLFVAHPSVTAPALEHCRTALGTGKTIAVAELAELHRLIRCGDSLRAHLEKRLHSVVLEREPRAGAINPLS
ncbi:MAG: hypothetical protein RID81_00120 [Sandaracinaceae bacterium]